MKIWTLEQFIDGIPQIEVVYTEAEADEKYDTHYRALWAKVMGELPYPACSETAHSILTGEDVGDDELMWITQHDISDHPSLKGSTP